MRGWCGHRVLRETQHLLHVPLSSLYSGPKQPAHTPSRLTRPPAAAGPAVKPCPALTPATLLGRHARPGIAGPPFSAHRGSHSCSPGLLKGRPPHRPGRGCSSRCGGRVCADPEPLPRPTGRASGQAGHAPRSHRCCPRAMGHLTVSSDSSNGLNAAPAESPGGRPVSQKACPHILSRGTPRHPVKTQGPHPHQAPTPLGALL